MVNIYAPINNLGFGIHSVNMIKAFKDNGIDISLNTIGQPQPNGYYKKYIEGLHGNFSLFDSSAPSLHIFHDEYLTNVGGGDKIAFSVFETDKINDHVAFNLKNVADKVFTTTHSHRDILIDHGIDPDKIDVVHEGIDPELYNHKPCDKYIDTGKFTYITVGKNEERKNTSMIIRTFIEDMQYKECALICHTFNPFSRPGDGGAVTSKQFTDIEFEKYGFKQEHIGQQYTMYSNGICDIYLTYPIQDQALMKNLYHSANVGIAISRAEGWDLPCMELMACGVPTIVSNVIGHSEYLYGAHTDLIIQPDGMEIANDGIWFKGDKGKWAIINDDDLSEKLEDTFDNKDKYIQKDAKMANYYRDNYNWDKAAMQVKELLNL